MELFLNLLCSVYTLLINLVAIRIYKINTIFFEFWCFKSFGSMVNIITATYDLFSSNYVNI